MIHPSLLKRKIIHIDMDAFYAAIEELDNSSLRGKPVVVGGMPNSRGVVSTANYVARKFGIRSAIPSSQAFRLCPHAVFLPPRFERYKEIAQIIRGILRSYTPLVEPLSLDEAYLDVTEQAHQRFASTIAKEIRKEIFHTSGLTASAGVAPNKMVAKIATDMRKPNGQTVVMPDQVFSFMQGLPVQKIPFVGPATMRRLQPLNIVTCADVLSCDLDLLTQQIGNNALWLRERAKGIDESQVVTNYVRKSIGEETTFQRDLKTREDMQEALKKICQDLFRSAERKGLRARRVTLKVKFPDFVQVTRSRTIPQCLSSFDELKEIVFQLMEKHEVYARPVRLLGVSLAKFENEDVVLLSGW